MFSVLMCVYASDSPRNFGRALRSIWNEQTLKPTQIVLVVDGPIGDELTSVINQTDSELVNVLNVIWLSSNVGHGRARQAGLKVCSEEWIAVMDADDIAMPKRLEMLASVIKREPNISVIGSALAEFKEVEGELIEVGNRFFPETHAEIIAQLPWRSPFAQPTVAFSREAVLKVGGYQHWYYNEDYYLWVRLAEAGYCFHNIRSITIRFRTSDNTFKRRGGLKYWLSESKLQLYIYKSSISGGLRPLVVGVLGRLVVQVVLPNSLRAKFYSVFLR